ncbi:methyltransferase family protein [Micromonospora sp. BQ11]|uniref:methyltransferase family protein n=1 Tax=Micromonospora sp. BQ11 TaxID=3452212 RepID=UPI003F89849F
MTTSVSSAVFRAPRILFVVAVGLALAGVAVRMSDPAGALRGTALTLTVAYLAWLLVEVPVTFAHPTGVQDGRTLVPYALARLATLGSTALLPLPWAAWFPLLLLPVALFVGGVALREVAIRTLGRFYSHHVARRTDQVAVTTGVYQPIRHPAYAGMLLAHLGLVAFFLNPVSVLCLLLLLAAVVFRIRVEEQALLDVPGYAEYAANRSRLLPGVW